MPTEGTRTKDGLVCAYAEHVIVRPYQRSDDIIVVENSPNVFKGTVLSVGEDVPPPITPGDLIWYTMACEFEKDLFAVAFENIIAYSRFLDE